MMKCRWYALLIVPTMVLCCVYPVRAQMVSVKDFGAVGNGSTDDTQAIQAAFDQAKQASCTILFPAGRYKVSETLHLDNPNPYDVVTEIQGQGYPQIAQTDSNKDIFYAPDAWRLTIRGVRFTGGRDQISLGNVNLEAGFLLIIDCRFNYSKGVAIRFHKETHSTFALVEKCAFRECMQALVAVSDQVMVRDCWITSSPEMRNQAVIENYGIMSCENIIGVTLVNGQDQRWIDNHSLLVCRFFSFGGESGGFTPVVNFGSLVVLDTCQTVCGLGNAQRPCAVYCERIPSHLVIRNCHLIGIPPVMISPKIDLKTYFEGIPSGMLRFDISGNRGEFAGDLPQDLLQAAANRRQTREYGDQQLSVADTEKALAVAVEAAKRVASAPPGETDEHKQQTEADKYLDITLQNHKWDLEEYMDGTREKNSAYLAVASAGDDVVILRRLAGRWPHVFIRDVTLDLDKHPFLSWRLKDNGLDPAGYAVKVVDADSKQTILLTEMNWGSFFAYQAFDLRKACSLEGGTHTFHIKFYFLGNNQKSTTECVTAEAGDFLLLDFLRAEAE